MAHNRHNPAFRFIAVIAIVMALAFLLLPHADHVTPCLVLFSAILIEVLPLVQHIQGGHDRGHDLLPDSPATPASFQRPPPSIA
jgi:hypothetical protein